MNNITYTQRYLPHELVTRYHAVKLYRNGYSVPIVCRRYHISKSSLMRWNKQFDGDKHHTLWQVRPALYHCGKDQRECVWNPRHSVFLWTYRYLLLVSDLTGQLFTLRVHLFNIDPLLPLVNDIEQSDALTKKFLFKHSNKLSCSSKFRTKQLLLYKLAYIGNKKPAHIDIIFLSRI